MKHTYDGMDNGPTPIRLEGAAIAVPIGCALQRSLSTRNMVEIRRDWSDNLEGNIVRRDQPCIALDPSIKSACQRLMFVSWPVIRPLNNRYRGMIP